MKKFLYCFGANLIIMKQKLFERLFFTFLFTIVCVLALPALVSASTFEFNGTVNDVGGNALSNATINITIRDTQNEFGIVGYNTTTTNESGWFNLSVALSGGDPSAWMYELRIIKTNETLNYVQFVGQTLPALPFFMLQQVAGIDFFLREAGTINITAINSSGDRVPFNYQVKDKLLGFPIAENLAEESGMVNEVSINVPNDRDYAIMVFPNASMPVSADWSNFSAESNPFPVGGISSYNVTTKTLNKQFNITMEGVRVSGYLNGDDIGIEGWDEIAIVPYIVEPGNMIHTGFSTMPYNLSAFFEVNGSDVFDQASGFYNMTLPATVEYSQMLLLAVGRNDSGYYGGFGNLSLDVGDSNINLNFTMQGLLGVQRNISLEGIEGPESGKNITILQQKFNLVNSTSSSLENSFAHIETKTDYSSLGVMEFTWMSSVEQGAESTFFLPLLNTTNVKEINIYTSDYAPKRLSPTIAELIQNNLNNNNMSNITLTPFSPGDPEGNAIDFESLFMALYKSSDACDIPSPGEDCIIISSEVESDAGETGPMKAIFGGGEISFRMGVGNIRVHYINVDLLASGPPDALFDSEAQESSGDNFESAMKFGSGGPGIYDYVLVGMSYTNGSSEQSGLNDSAAVNISVPLFYDEDWNVIWNVTTNGTNATQLAGNFSHYSEKQTEWQTLLGGVECHENGASASYINASSPCYIDKNNTMIWVRLPHFSGTGPKVSGESIVVSSGSGSSGSSGGGGGGTRISSSPVELPSIELPQRAKIHSWLLLNPGSKVTMKEFGTEIGVKEIEISVKNRVQNGTISVIRHDGKPISVSVIKEGRVYQYIQIKPENMGELNKAVVQFKVEKSWAEEEGLDKEDITVFKYGESERVWNELETELAGEDGTYYYYNLELSSFSYFVIGEKTQTINQEDESSNEVTPPFESENVLLEEEGKNGWLIVLLGIGLLGLLIAFFVTKSTKRPTKRK